MPYLQVQWEQQNPDELLQHEMEQKKAMQQLSGAVQRLEEKLDTIKSAQACSQKDWRIDCKVHTDTGQDTNCAAVHMQHMTAQSPQAADAPAALKQECADSAHAVSPECASNLSRQPSCSSQQSSALPAAVDTASVDTVQPQVSTISSRSNCCPDINPQNQSSTAYMRWLRAVAAVEVASSQLRMQSSDCATQSVSYAHLLQVQQCASGQPPQT